MLNSLILNFRPIDQTIFNFLSQSIRYPTRKSLVLRHDVANSILDITEQLHDYFLLRLFNFRLE